MNDDTRNKITQIYNTIMDKPTQVYNIFKDFFGEDFVDLQGAPTLDECLLRLENNYSEEKLDELPNSSISNYIFTLSSSMFILVRFPEVTVTNENDRSIVIWELFAKVKITNRGKNIGGFTLNRAKYDSFQFRNDYMHSHVNDIPISNFEEFQPPCLGNGPIRNTIALLNDSFDEARWQLFCLELSKYVTVESLDGGPYKRMEQLGSNSYLSGPSNWNYLTDSDIPKFANMTSEILRNFLKWFLGRNKLKFYYSGGWNIAMSYFNMVTLFSNEFIEWYNQEYIRGRVTATFNSFILENSLKRGIIKNNKFYWNRRNQGFRTNYEQYIGKRVCKFKGQDVRLVITDINNIDNNDSTFLHPIIVESIYKAIIEVINFEYGNIKDDSNSDTQIRSTKKKYFI